MFYLESWNAPCRKDETVEEADGYEELLTVGQLVPPLAQLLPDPPSQHFNG